jgi:hypothetical protein
MREKKRGPNQGSLAGHNIYPYYNKHSIRPQPFGCAYSFILPPPHTYTKMTWIRQNELFKLREYKYSGVDHSLVSRYILKPFYSNFVIHLFPMSMA